KFLVGRIRSRRDAKPGRGSIAWLALHLGTMGYPQFVVSAPEPAYSLSLSLSLSFVFHLDDTSHQPTPEARLLIDAAVKHKAEKFKERQEREGPGEGVGEKKKKRKSAVAYKNTLRKS